MASPSLRQFKSVVRVKALQLIGVKSLTASVTATRMLNAGRTNVLNAAAGLTVTLPASTGGGNVFKFVVGTTATSGSYVVKVANSSDVMVGGILINDIGDTSAATSDFFPTAASSDTFTMTYTLGGGKAGDWVEVEDIALNKWAIRGTMQGLTDPATPFSATV